MKRTHGWRQVAGSLAIGSLLLSGCSSSSSSGGGSVTGNFGVLSCFTGRLASLGQAMLQGSQVAQKAINDAGGLLGKQVTLYHADTGCDLADSVPALQSLLSHPLAGIIGPETQEIAAVEPILKAKHIVTEFQGGDTSRDHQTDPYLFRDSPSDSQLGVAMALYAHQKGYTRAAQRFYPAAAAQTFQAPITAAFTKLGGTIVINKSIAPGQTSYLPEIRPVIAAHPQALFTPTPTPAAAFIYLAL